MFQFTCSSCGQIHRGMPTFGFSFPIQYLDIPNTEREQRVSLNPNECVIDDQWFFVRGSIEIPVHESPEPLIWGVWVSLSERSFKTFRDFFQQPKKPYPGPFLGWLASDMRPYEETCVNLKTRTHVRDSQMRPSIELEPTHHRLAVEQREGISVQRVAEIYALMVHD